MATHDDKVIINVNLEQYFQGTGTLRIVMMWGVSNGTMAANEVMEFTKPPTSAERSKLGTSLTPSVLAFFDNAINPYILKVCNLVDLTAPSLADAYNADPDFFYLVYIPRDLTGQTALLTFVDGLDVIAIVQSADPNNKSVYTPGGGTAIGDLARNADQENFIVVYHTSDTEYVIESIAGRKSVDLDKQSVNWANCNLEGPNPATGITSTQLTNLRDKGVNTYLQFYNTQTFADGKTSSLDAIDEIVTKYWTKISVRAKIAQFLAQESSNNRKIPYNNGGIGQIANIVSGQLTAGVQAQHFDNFRIDMPNAFDIPAPTKQTRKLTFSFVCQLTGAIESVEGTGWLSYDVIVPVA